MSTVRHAASDPFGMIIDPQSVLDAIERVQRTSTLKGRICRPLDKPLIPKVEAAGNMPFEADLEEDPEPESTADLDPFGCR